VIDSSVSLKWWLDDEEYVAQEQRIDFVTGDERLLSTVREDLEFVYHLSTLSL